MSVRWLVTQVPIDYSVGMGLLGRNSSLRRPFITLLLAFTMLQAPETFCVQTCLFRGEGPHTRGVDQNPWRGPHLARRSPIFTRAGNRQDLPRFQGVRSHLGILLRPFLDSEGISRSE